MTVPDTTAPVPPSGSGDARARTLVTSYCFPPYNDAAGVVAAKRVREYGEPVDVICNAMDKIRPRDEGLVHIAGPLVRDWTALETPTAFSSWTSIREFARAGLQVALRWEREKGAYESLYSRAQFAASHFLAARYKSLRPDVHWRAEFSDPLSHDVTGAERHSPMDDDDLTRRLSEGLLASGVTPPDSLNAYVWCEHIAFALADEIIFTNPAQAEMMIAACPDRELARRVERVGTVRPHPTLPSDFYGLAHPDYSLDPDRRHIGYFGNFYATRGVGYVLDALAGLSRADRQRLQLHVFTSKPNVLEEAVESRELEGVVVAQPFVDFLDFLALSRRFDCLLVNDAETPAGAVRNPFLPSKWSDYCGSGSRVWGVLEEGSPLSERPLDYRSPIGHVTAAQQVLTRIARS